MRLGFHLANGWIGPESIEWFIEDQALSPSYDLVPARPPTPSPPASKFSLFFQSSYVSPSELGDERWKGEGVGEEPNHTTRESLVLYKAFDTLWIGL